MKFTTRIFFTLLFVLSLNVVLFAQDDEPKTIKVKRESNLVKAYFDNTELKLLPIDRFGNPRENKIKSFKLYVKGKKVKTFSGYDNNLSSEMVGELNGQKKATKIYFTEIMVEDDDGHLVKLPDIYEVWFPTCKNCDVNKKGKN